MTPVETDDVKWHSLIRKYKGTKGTSIINLTFYPKITYGEKSSVIKTFADRLEFDTNQQKITLYCLLYSKHFQPAWNLIWYAEQQPEPGR